MFFKKYIQRYPYHYYHHVITKNVSTVNIISAWHQPVSIVTVNTLAS